MLFITLCSRQKALDSPVEPEREAEPTATPPGTARLPLTENGDGFPGHGFGGRERLAIRCGAADAPADAAPIPSCPSPSHTRFAAPFRPSRNNPAQGAMHKGIIRLFRHRHQPEYLHLRSETDGVARITSWADGLMFERWGRLHGWSRRPNSDAPAPRRQATAPFWGWWRDERDPDLPLLGLHGLPVPQAQWLEDFLRPIPAHVREAAGQFTWRQFTILRMMRRTDYAVQLATSNPTLLWLVAARLVRNRRLTGDIPDLLKMKQTALIRLLFGDGTGVTPALLRKTRSHSYDSATFRDAERLLCNAEAVGQLRHYPVIDLDRLGELDGRYDILAAKFLKRRFLAPEPSPRPLSLVRGEYMDTVGLGKSLGIQDAGQVVRACPTVQALQHLHARWANAVRRMAWFRENRGRWGTVFPRPPYMSDGVIIPIRTPEELLEEGRWQDHCVWNYADLVEAGLCTIYRVLYPQRATLELRGGRGNAHVGQLFLRHNGEPSPRCWAYVLNWLDEQNRRARAAKPPARPPAG
ncbi:hypothetical protein DND132_2466 [Pseudodesulfovibrio mercurii]|uniref:PcfJ-like protein n=1 Tax=Pseudodesulfovibrio mercurii TaxID=641491 RepID=F0JCI9_9BACT|nr:PcfJ domain-containing protein [Pseudodesulfovibrio mercurii]EGB15669.1 hypothetical protein DND132_2466 [Pseudodesulfovibrio mercurii]